MLIVKSVEALERKKIRAPLQRFNASTFQQARAFVRVRPAMFHSGLPERCGFAAQEKRRNGFDARETAAHGAFLQSMAFGFNPTCGKLVKRDVCNLVTGKPVKFVQTVLGAAFGKSLVSGSELDFPQFLSEAKK
jgi:hypothetical protein